MDPVGHQLQARLNALSKRLGVEVPEDFLLREHWTAEDFQQVDGIIRSLAREAVARGVPLDELAPILLDKD